MYVLEAQSPQGNWRIVGEFVSEYEAILYALRFKLADYRVYAI